MVEFSKFTLSDDGKKLVETKVRDIKQSDIQKCPHYILMAEHYREDGSCKCNDPNETIMNEWGYCWNGKVWEVDDDNVI